MTTQTPATAEIEKWHRLRSGFSQIVSPVPKKNEESCWSRLRIHGHL